MIELQTVYKERMVASSYSYYAIASILAAEEGVLEKVRGERDKTLRGESSYQGIVVHLTLR